MFSKFKGILFNTTLNISFFFLLIIGIQNSSNKVKVNLLINETIKLPISFIIGTSFISGSLLGGFISLNFIKPSKSS
ncbi:hypothetical protein CU313_06740 [Prochlorococcus marinus str. MU1404]|uniref:hypothetical protein n=1 Tax=Prochlorococcus marinus TaxID=1219 RepID=UPI001ADA6D2D|nr:hypothetical protein [Prochlorococcus marinus]MBO8230519.1 hypothetical protein [Prochlorococcus marinus XMU1404]MBW3073565.1 hypothetical protein [Prochlorococcus marinus str. MU1404]MCR8545147.1 hypothetical protein [Prochlorococcus marinus CUG1432]